MIHVCFSLYDKTGLFSKFTGTALLSLFENTNTPSPSITVHILTDNTLSEENRDKLASIAARYGQIIKFYDVEKLCPDRIENIRIRCARVVRQRFTIATFYRFVIPHILPPEIEKIIYLDSDIVVNLDIEELWKIDIGENVLGVVTRHSQILNPPKNDNLYDFNAGVLLINMKVFKDEEETLNKGIEFTSSNTQYSCDDQTILNYCFEKKSFHLPVKFNRLVKWDRWQKVTQIDKKIYHFNHHSSEKGLGFDMNDPYNRLWMSYFIRTPWFDAESIGRLYENFQKTRNDLKDYVAKVSANMSNKSRGFFFEPKKEKSMKKVFSIRDDEEVILAENVDSIKKLIMSMKQAAGKKVFFILTGDYLTQNFLGKKFPFDQLKKEGFIEGKDFLKGWDLLSSTNGSKFNSYSLIQVL